MGGIKSSLGENFYEPTLITGVSSDMRCAMEEQFGPVAAITKYVYPMWKNGSSFGGDALSLHLRGPNFLL